ncbi:MAG: threonine-phosphate decarboxylase, partial [Rhodospirillales bacterium]|nr:threonine-phosphate decarboxylase [Rhodospirillales bacterium]
MDSEKPYHGGDPKFAEAEFGRPDGGWLDLSTGINPFAYPVESMSLDGLCQLPTSTELEALLTAARDYYRLPVDARLIAAPGSQAVLQLLPYMRPPARVHVLAPTYEE